MGLKKRLVCQKMYKLWITFTMITWELVCSLKPPTDNTHPVASVKNTVPVNALAGAKWVFSSKQQAVTSAYLQSPPGNENNVGKSSTIPVTLTIRMLMNSRAFSNHKEEGNHHLFRSVMLRKMIDPNSRVKRQLLSSEYDIEINSSRDILPNSRLLPETIPEYQEYLENTFLSYPELFTSETPRSTHTKSYSGSIAKADSFILNEVFESSEQLASEINNKGIDTSAPQLRSSKKDEMDVHQDESSQTTNNTFRSTSSLPSLAESSSGQYDYMNLLAENDRLKSVPIHGTPQRQEPYTSPDTQGESSALFFPTEPNNIRTNEKMDLIGSSFILENMRSSERSVAPAPTEVKEQSSSLHATAVTSKNERIDFSTHHITSISIIPPNTEASTAPSKGRIADKNAKSRLISKFLQRPVGQIGEKLKTVGIYDSKRSLLIANSSDCHFGKQACLKSAATFVINTDNEIRMGESPVNQSLPRSIQVKVSQTLKEAELVRVFKSKYPVKRWKTLGFLQDEYLDNINPHWMKYDPPNPLIHEIFAILYGVFMIVGCGGNLLVICMFASLGPR